MIKDKSVIIEHAYECYRVNWSAIFAGALVGVGLGFLLHLYSIAINLSVFSASPSNASVIAIGGLLGMIICVIVTMLLAGFVAGYLGRYHYHHIKGGLIYGFITWSLILLISVLIAGPLIHYEMKYGQSLVEANNFKTNATNLPSATANGNPNISNNTLSANNVAPVNNNILPTPLTAKQITWAGWIIFVLFFLGALFCCIGACYGMTCKREETLAS